MKLKRKAVVALLSLFVVATALEQEALGQAMTMGDAPFFATLNLSRSKKLDDLQVQVTYKLNWHYHGDSHSQTDIRTLLIGNEYTYSRNELLYQADSLATVQINKGAKGTRSFSQPTIPYEVWTNRLKQTSKVGFRLPCDRFTLTFEESTPVLKWEIDTNGTSQTLLGYSCTKATTTYRGKEVTAWFASQLPYNVGPYCFSGLPGLILKVEMGQTTWEAIGIRKGKENEEIKVYARSQEAQSRKEVITFIKQIYQDLVAIYSSLGVSCFSSEAPDTQLSSGAITWHIPELILVEQ